MTKPPALAAALADELKRRIAGEVRFDDGSRGLYATDASNYRQVPIGVVIPRTAEDVVATVEACRRHDAPVLARGAGTSLAGQCCNVAVVLDMSKYLNRILDIDVARRCATVEPGCILDHLRDRAEEHHLTFGPDPATHDQNTLGGMIGNNSCGVHSVMAGRTADNVRALEILTYDGERMWVGETPPEELDAIIAAGGRRGDIYRRLRDLRDRHADQIRARFPDIPRRVSGFNLPQLLPERGFNVARALVGSEGTCVLVLRAVLDLVPSPPGRTLLVLGYRDVFAAADHVPELLGHGPIGLEGMDDLLVSYLDRRGMDREHLQLLPDGAGWLLAEFGGEDGAQAADSARRAMAALEQGGEPPTMRLFDDPADQKKLWELRESGLAATAHVPGKPSTWEGWEDAAVPPDRLGSYLRGFRALLDLYGYECSLYGHFGDGCVHVRIDFDLVSEEGIAKFRRFVDDAADLVLGHGGSFSGEHGDGQARAELLPKMFGDELVEAFRSFKAIWDPGNRMNPGKVVDPYPITANLRLGAGFDPPHPRTEFAYAEDDGDFAKVALRCVGVGKCRHYAGGVMCPSFMVTGEEMHSTRGRARLLFEMLQGDPVAGGWRSEAVREALDLCLACKGCKTDCPVGVDMATYKAEFFARYYRGRLRPRSAYTMGLIHQWSRIAARMPGVVNFVTAAPLLGRAVKTAGGIAAERAMPRYARRTFKQAFRRRDSAADGRPVILWPDTFYNHFHPEVAMAAVAVLEDAGSTVTVPEAPLCCARPLYAWGMLDRARRELGKILDRLGPEIDRGVPVVGLEPACIATFRDELPNLFPDDERAGRLCRQSFLLGEFLDREGYRPPPLKRRALVHVHCNQHAVIGVAGDKQLMAAMGLDFELLDSGCCGMAGAFGFEHDHYDIAMKAGERVLLPAVRAAAADTLIVTNGYSCREQIAQATPRRALHIAELLHMALPSPAAPDGGGRR